MVAEEAAGEAEKLNRLSDISPDVEGWEGISGGE